MRSLLSETLFFLKGQPGHPVYRREVMGWSYLGFWRRLRRGCVPLMGLIMLAMSCCCGVMIVPAAFEAPDTTPTILFLMLPGILWFGIFSGGEIINLLAGLLATALTSTTISAEVEAETYPLLRLTSITPREIVLAKLGAAFNQLRLPIVTIMASRLIAVIGGIVLLVFYSIVLSTSPAGISPGPSPGQPSSLTIPIETWATLLLPFLTGVIGLLVAGVIWLITYALFKPFADILLFLAVGLFASSLARTRSGGLFTAGGMRVALWVIGYVFSQIMSSFFSIVMLPMALMSTNTSWFERVLSDRPDLVLLGGAGITVVIVLVTVAAEFAVTLLLLNVTRNRAERLPFTTG